MYFISRDEQEVYVLELKVALKKHQWRIIAVVLSVSSSSCFPGGMKLDILVAVHCYSFEEAGFGMRNRFRWESGFQFCNALRFLGFCSLTT